MLFGANFYLVLFIVQQLDKTLSQDIDLSCQERIAGPGAHGCGQFLVCTV